MRSFSIIKIKEGINKDEAVIKSNSSNNNNNKIFGKSLLNFSAPFPSVKNHSIHSRSIGSWVCKPCYLVCYYNRTQCVIQPCTISLSAKRIKKKKKTPRFSRCWLAIQFAPRNSLSRDCQNSASMLRDHWCQSVSYFPLSTWIFFSVAVILVGFLMLVWKNR